MTRRLDADARLRGLVAARLKQGFAWGARDCVVWPFDAAEAQTGRDAFADLRGTYRSALGAIRQLLLVGGLEVLASRVGPEIQVSDVRDGDVALLKSDVCAGPTAEHGALGVAWQGGIAAQGDQGLVSVPATAALRWWRPA